MRKTAGSCPGLPVLGAGAAILALGNLALAGVAAARDLAPAAPPTPSASRAPPSVDPERSLGSISLGHPHDGRLVNAVELPPGAGWVRTVPEQSFGTDETIQALVFVIGRVRAEHPETPAAFIGSISARRGGKLHPHKSHQSGRDADVHFYLTKRDPRRWYEPATAENLDRPRNWTLLRSLITETDIDFVLIDREVAALLERHALDVGEDPAWVDDVFHGTRAPSDGRRGGRLVPASTALIKHAPGHTGHMHIRFTSPHARRRGRATYETLLRQGHLELGERDATHVAVAGDTLSALSRRFGVSVAELKEWNGLASPFIRAGQTLRVKQRIDLRGAFDPVVVPSRRLPRRGPSLDPLGLAFRQQLEKSR